MKRYAKHILLALTVLLLFLPMVQEHLRLFDFRKLSGVVAENPQPEPTLEHFTDNSMQDWVENYLRLHYGLREPFTRAYNQYLWDFFGKSNVVSRKFIYISDDGWIYERPSLEEYYQSKKRYYSYDSAAVARNFGEEVLRLYQLQQILEERGTHLFVALLPGKELIYPEHVPVTNEFDGEPTFSAWEFYRDRLQTMGVNHIDFGQWFLDLKDTVDYPLFPQTGTHWSNYAAMHVADSIIRYMEWLGDIKMEHFIIGEREQRTVEPDDDLEQLMNLARPLPKTPNYYAPYTIIDDSTASRPKLITIGDSFYWNLLNAAPFGKVMGSSRYWYYFNTVYFDDEHNNIGEVDVMQEVLDADFVMIAYNTSQLYKMSQGFSQQLLIDLCCDPEYYAAAQEDLAKKIKANKQWMNTLIPRAEKYDVPIDSAVVKEAQTVMAKNPNRFIPGLKDTIPTLRSQKFIQYQGAQ